MSTEKTGTGVNWSRVRFVMNGSQVDLSATLAAMQSEAETFLSSNVVDTTAIAEAVNSVFTRMGEAENKLVELETLALKALGSMTENVDDESKMLKSIKSFIRSESEKFVASSGAEGRFWIRAGRGGGVRLSTPSTVEAFRTLQTRKAGTVSL
jgi:hypothetical protein